MPASIQIEQRDELSHGFCVSARFEQKSGIVKSEDDDLFHLAHDRVVAYPRRLYERHVVVLRGFDDLRHALQQLPRFSWLLGQTLR